MYELRKVVLDVKPSDLLHENRPISDTGWGFLLTWRNKALRLEGGKMP